MRNTLKILLVALFIGTSLSAQIKVGDNPQNIDPSSVLELESTDKVLVITRVTTAQMNAIVPSQGALCFNTDLQSVHYYNGTQWVNIGGGGGTGGPLTADPIVNTVSTIVITPTATGDNLEVAPNSIQSEQIVDFGITGDDIQNNSIGPGKLLNNSVTQDKLSENSVGAFALDNDNIGLSAFNDDINNITAGNLISADPDNSVVAGPDGGVFYDDAILIMDIADVSQDINDHILADDDTSDTNELQTLSIAGNEITISGQNTISLPPGSVADGSETKINAGNNVTITGDGTNATPYIINSTGGGTGGATDLNFNQTTNILTLSNPATAGNEVDLSSLAGGGTGGSDNSNFFVATDSLRITDGAGTLAVALSELGSGGTNQNASQVPFTPYLTLGSTDTQAAVQELKDELDSAVITGGGSNNSAFTIANDSLNITDGDGTLSVPLLGLGFENTNFGVVNDSLVITDAIGSLKVPVADIASAAGGSDNTAFTIANDSLNITDGDGTLSVPLSGLGFENTNFGIVNDSLVITDAIGSLKVPVADIASAAGGSDNTAFTIANDSLNITDGDGTLSVPLSRLGFENTNFGVVNDSLVITDAIGSLKVPVADITSSGNNSLVEVTSDSLIVEDAGGRLGVPLDSLAHKGVPKSIFFAGADSIPRQFFNPDNDAPSFYWDYEGRTAGASSYGTLAIGLDGGVISNDVKVHIAEQLTAGGNLSYGLMLQNRANGEGRGVGMVLSVDDFSTTYGKGALVFERDSTFARGDIHFLQNNEETTLNPTWVDKAFTVTREKNIGLYGGIDIGGAGIGFGMNNQVLASGGPGSPVKWIDNNGSNLSTANLTQNSGQDRTYNLNGQSLEFTGSGTIGIGIFDNDVGTPAPALSTSNKLHVAGTIRAEGIRNTPGTLPSSVAYSFNDDSDTGMYRAGVNEVGLVTMGIEALRINNEQKVGIGTIDPTSTLHTGGSFAANIRNDGATTVTLQDKDYTVILSNATSVNIPAAEAANLGRIYILKNATGVIINIPDYIPSNGSNDLGDGAVLQIQSDGSNWYQIN